jgi:hypothetical protein
MSTRSFAAGGRLAVPSAYIAAEPRRVGKPYPYLLIKLPKVGSYKPT